jgi:hypothetical protein
VRVLLKLWEGIPAVDLSKDEGEQNFILRSILLWIVNDFSAYGLISGQQVKGYCGCPICGEFTRAEHSANLRKMTYLGHRRRLAENHRFRRSRLAFNGEQEFQVAPQRPSGEDIVHMAAAHQHYLQAGGVRDGPDDPVKKNGVKRCSILFDLPYWIVSNIL